MTIDPELAACTADPLNPAGFNPNVVLPYGLTTEHIREAMEEFLDFLGFINQQLNTRTIGRLETFLMSANFSSMVGEMMAASIPKFCPTPIRNPYHNGYPDMIPTGHYAAVGVLRGDEGIEIKASRYASGWQGHNAEEGFLMIFIFASNRPSDLAADVPPRPFRFVRVVAERLTSADWSFSGRSETSRRTITASVTRSGYTRLMANWVYDASR